MSCQLKFDFIIIGGGLSGLQLAYAFSKDSWFKDKSIAIIEAESKTKNDKTWCFWEKGNGDWEDVLYKKWDNGIFNSKSASLALDMGEYSYKMIRSIDFYKFVRTELDKSKNIQFIADRISKVDSNVCFGNTEQYFGEKVFDSRLNVDFNNDTKSITILQHFKGWLIETVSPQFNPDEFVMMDYQIGNKNDCCFTYVLPISETKAIVEFTFFTPELGNEEVYDTKLKEYINEILKIDEFNLLETEQGVIPMTTFPFEKENKDNYLKIGTAGGWVKASSGYSFKNTENKIKQLLLNIKSDKNLDNKLINKKYQFYDRIMLRILQNENHLGNQVFQEMYERNKASDIFQFLDEKMSLFQEIKVINSFTKAPFLRSLLKEIIN